MLNQSSIQSIYRQGTSRAEIVLVTGILGLLFLIMIPALRVARDSSRRLVCLDHFRQVGEAIQAYESSVGHLPVDGQDEWGFAATLLPTLQPTLAAEIGPLADTEPAQCDCHRIIVDQLLCPSLWRPEHLEDGYARSAALASPILASEISLAEIFDGPGNTICVGETTREHAWALPQQGTFDRRIQRGNFGSHHPGGAVFTFCDGSVRFLSGSMQLDVFQALSTPNGGD